MEVKTFNKWSSEGISVQEEGLKSYIETKPTFVPRTGARYAGNRFHKSKVFIVERLMNKLQNSGHKGKKHTKSSGYNTGKSHTIFNIMEKTLEIVEQRTKQNPIAVLVKAIENAAPREEILMIEYGGAHYPKPVECAPQRRVDMVLRLFTQGAYQKSFNSKKAIEVALADEIVNAYNSSQQSIAIAKKHEMERQADSSR